MIASEEREGRDQSAGRSPQRAVASSLVAVVCFAASAHGQANLSLQQAIDQALNANPRLSVAQARTQEAIGQEQQASLRPNPRLTLQTEDIRPSANSLPFSFVNSTEDYITISQVIETAGKRGKRVDVADSLVKTTHIEQDLTKRQIIGTVSAAYWLVASYVRFRDLLQQTLRTYEEDVTYSRNRVKEGFMAESDLMSIQLERDRIYAGVITATREANQRFVNLYRAMGKTEFPPTNLTDSLENVSKVAIPELTRVLQVRPEMQLARQAVTEAAANIKLQKAIAKPDPQAAVGYKRNVGYDTFYAALQIDLPVRNKNQGNIGSAAARLHMAQSNLKITEASVTADLEAARKAYQDQQQLLDSLPATLARANESERLARAAYREGGIDLLRLLDAERSRIQVQTDYYRALATLHQSIVNLNLASGGGAPGEMIP
jgi:cobalt-zinc-cadmium efflux system outer membrane protein